MVKFDLGLDTMDEFVKIAFEKGWISKEAQGLTPRQQSHLRALMYRYHEGEQEALERAQRESPKLWQELAKPEVPTEQPFVPQTPAWVTDPKGYEARSKEVTEMEKLKTEKPMGEEILSEIPGRMLGKYIEIFMGQGMTREQAEAKAKQILGQKSDDMEAEAMSKEKNLLKVSAITSELVSLANDLDSMGEKEAADAVDKQLTLFKNAANKLYDITGETGEKFINEVHPGGGPVQVPAKDEGGKVETIVEQQKKDIEVATKNPTGKYAETILKLIVTANRLEDEGNVEAAQMVDKAIEELRQAALPFVDRNSVFGATDSKDNKASIGKRAETNIKTILQTMIAGLTELEDTVQDMGPYWLPKRFAVTYGGNLYKLKYDKFIVAARKDLEKFIESVTPDVGVLSPIVDDINANLMKIKSFYSADPSVFEGMIGFKYGEWSPKGEVLWNQAYKAFREGKPEKAVPSTKPGESGKPVPAKTQASELPQLNTYKNSLVKLQAALKNPKNQDALLKALGGGKADKGIDVLPKRQQWVASEIAWVSKLLGQKQDESKTSELEALAIRKNRFMWANLIKPLQQWGAIAIASSKAGLMKKAAPPGTDTPTVAPPPGKAPAKRPMAKRPDKDPQVEALQTALQTAGVNPGKVDGFWGPNTAVAYNAFISKNIGLEKYLQPVANPKAQRHANRPVAVLPKAIRIIQYMAGKERETGVLTIPLAGGINISLNAMTNPQNFASYMQSALNVNAFTPGAALQYLNELERYVGENEMDMEGKQPGAARMWQDAIANLTRSFQQFERQARSNPAFQYPWQPAGQQGQVAGKTPGQAGQGVKYVGPGGETGGGSDVWDRKIDANSLTSSDAIKHAINQLPPMSVLSLDRFTEDLAQGKGAEENKRIYNLVNSNLSTITRALMNMREKASEDPDYQRIWHDTGVYRAALANLRRSLRF